MVRRSCLIGICQNMKTGGCSINTGLPGRTQQRPSPKEFCMFMEKLYNSSSRKDVFKNNCPSQEDNCPSRKTCLKVSLPGRTLLRPSRRTVFMEQPPAITALCSSILREPFDGHTHVCAFTLTDFLRRVLKCGHKCGKNWKLAWKSSNKITRADALVSLFHSCLICS